MQILVKEYVGYCCVSVGNRGIHLGYCFVSVGNLNDGKTGDRIFAGVSRSVAGVCAVAGM